MSVPVGDGSVAVNQRGGGGSVDWVDVNQELLLKLKKIVGGWIDGCEPSAPKN